MTELILADAQIQLLTNSITKMLPQNNTWDECTLQYVNQQENIQENASNSINLIQNTNVEYRQTNWDDVPQNNSLQYEYRLEDFSDALELQTQNAIELFQTQGIDDELVDMNIRSLEKNLIRDKLEAIQRKRWISKYRRKVVKELVKEIFNNCINWRPTADNEQEELGLNCFSIQLLNQGQRRHHRQIHLRIISGFPRSQRRNKHLILVLDQDYNLVTTGGLREKTRQCIIRWLDNNYFQQYTTAVVNTPSTRWFYGSFSDYLEEQDILHNIQFFPPDFIDIRAQAIANLIPRNDVWDEYEVTIDTTRITATPATLYAEEPSFRSNPTIHSIEEVTIDTINNAEGLQTSSNLHKQLVNKIKNAKYVPARSAKQFAENTLANMSLATTLQNSPLIRQDWETYLHECNKWYESKTMKENPKEEEQFVNNVAIQVQKDVSFDFIPCKIYGKQALGMIDTGANISVISENFVIANQLQDKIKPTRQQIKLATGNASNVKGIIYNAPFQLDNKFHVIVNLLVTTATSYDLIIGRNLQRTLEMDIFSNRVEYVNPISKNKQSVRYSTNEAQLIEEGAIENFSVLFGEDQKNSYNLYPSFPFGQKYQMIIIDPPWQYNSHTVPSLKPPYKTLTIEQLKMLPITDIAAENSMLLLWTTGPMLEQAMDLIVTYGFKYRTILFSWLKQTEDKKPYPGKGNYTQPCTELLLIATKGNIQQMLKKDRKVSQFFQSQISKHSQKPKGIYKQINKLVDLQRTTNLEIFSREQQQYFDAYGNELPQTFLKSKESLSTQAKINLIQATQMHEESDQAVYMTDIQVENNEETIKQIQQIPIGSKDPQIKQQVKNMLKKFVALFASVFSQLGQTTLCQHEIHLRPDSKAVQQKPYRMAKVEIDFVKNEIQELIKLGFVKESVSEWASPIVLVKKANGKLRMCIDYRKLNAQTIDEKFPLPRIDDIFSQLQGAKVFSKLDLKSGFWQIPIKKEHQALTSFITPDSQYIWTRMPFGLKNAPSTFQRCMKIALEDYIRKFVMIYIDDVIIYSKTEQEHISHLNLIFTKLQQVDLKLGPDKCELLQYRINVLGHTIEDNQIFPMQSKVEAIQRIKAPTTRTQVRSFLGLTGYYRQFIPNFSKIAQPLHAISGEKSLWQWGNEQDIAFQKLKVSLMENPILNICLDDKPFTLYTDFSTLGLGAVLTQNVSDKREMVIEFASRTLAPYERNLDAYQGEVLAVYWSLSRFRHYLLGQKFTLVTDNKALEWVLKLNNPSRKINRWLIEILEYNFNIKHRKGTTHCNVDALSRLISETKVDGETQSVNNILDHKSDLDFKCKAINCKLQDSQHINIQDKLIGCSLCGDLWHQHCHQPRISKQKNQAWYCSTCQKQIQQMKQKDITLDFIVLDYINHQILPNNIVNTERNRIVRRATKYAIIDHRIYYRSKIGLRLVPFIAERKLLIKECHEIIGHQAFQKTLQYIQQHYTWHNLHQDIHNHIAACPTCNATNPKFSVSQDYFPTEKGRQPFDVVAMDLITNLPKTKRNNIHIVLAIDAFSKFIELRAIPNKNSSIVAKFTLEEFLCRYGCPLIIRTDKGKEFLGDFDALLIEYNIEHRSISQGYPQANSQAERSVQTIERILRRFLVEDQSGLEWDDILPFVARSMRVSISKSTQLSPYEVIYGLPMRIPDITNHHLKNYCNEDISDTAVIAYTKGMIKHLKQLHRKTLEALQKEDERQRQQHQRLPQNQGKQINFTPGQLVYLKRMRFNKMEPPVQGPYSFIKYLGDKGNVLIQDPATGKIRQQNSNQLAPLSKIVMENGDDQENNQINFIALINWPKLKKNSTQAKKSILMPKFGFLKITLIISQINQKFSSVQRIFIILYSNIALISEMNKQGTFISNSKNKYTLVNKQAAVFEKPDNYNIIVDMNCQLTPSDALNTISLAQSNVIVGNYKLVKEKPLNLTEKILMELLTHSANGSKVTYVYPPRVSMVRSLLTGRPYNQFFIVFGSYEDVYTAFITIRSRLWRFAFYNLQIQAVDCRLDYKLVSQDQLHSKQLSFYEDQIAKLFPTFSIPYLTTEQQFPVLFMTALTFKQQCLLAARGENLNKLMFTSFNFLSRQKKKPEDQRKFKKDSYYHFNIQSGKFYDCKKPEQQDVDDKLGQVMKQFEDEVAAEYKSKTTSCFLAVEKPFLPEDLRRSEKKILLESFEGRVLLDQNPFLRGNFSAFPSLKSNTYAEYVWGHIITALPKELLEKLKTTSGEQRVLANQIRTAQKRREQQHYNAELIELGQTQLSQNSPKEVAVIGETAVQLTAEELKDQRQNYYEQRKKEIELQLGGLELEKDRPLAEIRKDLAIDKLKQKQLQLQKDNQQQAVNLQKQLPSEKTPQKPNKTTLKLRLTPTKRKNSLLNDIQVQKGLTDHQPPRKTAIQPEQSAATASKSTTESSSKANSEDLENLASDENEKNFELKEQGVQTDNDYLTAMLKGVVGHLEVRIRECTNMVQEDVRRLSKEIKKLRKQD